MAAIEGIRREGRSAPKSAVQPRDVVTRDLTTIPASPGKNKSGLPLAERFDLEF